MGGRGHGLQCNSRPNTRKSCYRRDTVKWVIPKITSSKSMGARAPVPHSWRRQWWQRNSFSLPWPTATPATCRNIQFPGLSSQQAGTHREYQCFYGDLPEAAAGWIDRSESHAWGLELNSLTRRHSLDGRDDGDSVCVCWQCEACWKIALYSSSSRSHSN